MDKYKRQIKLRLAWWITWWSLVTLAAVLEVISTVDLVRHYELFSQTYRFSTLFWLVVFGLIAGLYVPGIDSLLKKDLKKNPENVYAKAMLLERELKKRKASEDVEKERGELERKVKSMEEELNK